MCLLLVSPKFNDGTGLEPAVVEMSRSVPARTALSPSLHSLSILAELLNPAPEWADVRPQ
jgi:hypothetical protein